MAASLLLSDAYQTTRSRSASVLSLLTASLLQAFAGALIIVLPLLGTPALPKPHRVPPTFVIPVTMPPPPESSDSKPVEPKTIRKIAPRANLSRRLLTPVQIPDGILEEVSSEFRGSAAVDGGISGGSWPDVVGGLPPPKEKPAVPVRPGGEIRRPTKVKHVEPVYPEIARKARIEGLVILEAIIDPSGRIGDLRVLRSVPLLDDAALSAVTQWQYEPTLLNGVPVPIVMTVTVWFALEGSR